MEKSKSTSDTRPTSPSPYTRGSEKLELYRASYRYDATEAKELSFREGDIITLLFKPEGSEGAGWWKGEVNGRKGFFPSTFVEPYVPHTKNQVAEAPPRLSKLQSDPKVADKKPDRL